MNSRIKVYRARDGVFFGICKGIAEAFDLDTFAVRLTMVALFIFSGFWPIVCVYLVAALFLKPDPLYHNASRDERGSGSVSSTAQKVKSKFADLEQRIRALENEVTNREYDWERRFYSQKQ